MTRLAWPPSRETPGTSTPRLVFFGNSVFLAGIKTQFQASTRAKWITVGTEAPDAADLIRRHQPAAIIFDLSVGYPDFAFSLLNDQPGLLLIGLMPSSDEMFLLSSHHARAQSVQDLFQVLDGLPDSPRERGHRFDGQRLREQLSSATALIPTRHGKLAVASTLIGLCAVLILALGQSAGIPNIPAPLVGTALGKGVSPGTELAFAGGLILGGLAVALYLRGHRRL